MLNTFEIKRKDNDAVVGYAWADSPENAEKIFKSRFTEHSFAMYFECPRKDKKEHGIKVRLCEDKFYSISKL